jgi:p-hydroxybenzoate 3-monooxygenase
MPTSLSLARDHYRGGDGRRLSAYTSTRLPEIWKAVEFSRWMLDLLLARTAEGRFREGLRDARLARLMAGQAFARHFAASYVGAGEGV